MFANRKMMKYYLLTHIWHCLAVCDKMIALLLRSANWERYCRIDSDFQPLRITHPLHYSIAPASAACVTFSSGPTLRWRHSATAPAATGEAAKHPTRHCDPFECIGAIRMNVHSICDRCGECGQGLPSSLRETSTTMQAPWRFTSLCSLNRTDAFLPVCGHGCVDQSLKPPLVTTTDSFTAPSAYSSPAFTKHPSPAETNRPTWSN